MILIEAKEVAPFHKNGFIVSCQRTREAVLIDPGDEVAMLLSAAERLRVTITYILLTHAHLDHITGVDAAKRALNVPICLHRDDLPLYDHIVDQGTMFGIPVEPQPPVDRFYEPAEVMAFGDCEVRV